MIDHSDPSRAALRGTSDERRRVHFFFFFAQHDRKEGMEAFSAKRAPEFKHK
jgi:hypothetical protein